MLVKDLTGDFVNQRVGDPSTVMTVGDFSKLVCANLIHRNLVCFFITFDRNLSRHPTNSGDLASETLRKHFFGNSRLQALLVASLN